MTGPKLTDALAGLQSGDKGAIMAWATFEAERLERIEQGDPRWALAQDLAEFWRVRANLPARTAT